MKLVAGLGNPGEKYKNSRHNIGYMVVEHVAITLGISWKYSQDWICYFAKNKNLVLVKPTTFMNKSGVAIAAVANFFKVDSKDVLVVYDEVDLPFGKIRLAFDGVSAGHHGVDSIIVNLGGVDFGRLRVGIGRPKGDKTKEEISDYVLSVFAESEVEQKTDLVKKSVQAVDSYLADGIEATMNRFN